MWPSTDEQLIRNAIFFSALSEQREVREKYFFLIVEKWYEFLEFLASCCFEGLAD